MRLLRSGERGAQVYLSEIEERMARGSVRLEREVRSILANVKKDGDEALLRYTQTFDRVRMTVNELRVEKRQIREAYKKVPRDFVGTMEKAAHRIEKFHGLVRKRLISSLEEEKDGIRLGQLSRPLERVGIYVPGGKASYPSTVLMAAIPAKVAGVRKIFMATPPTKNGISPAVLVAADLVRIDQIFCVGGAQAIAALAYGTASIPRVDKIVGPGNQYVATAKRLVYGVVDVDMVAGPSEILIISDGKGSPSFVAADLISQAEHDEMALAILITTSESFAGEVRNEVDRQLLTLKRRKIASTSLDRRGAILIVKNLKEAMKMANRIAPEHLELNVREPRSLVREVRHAGAVFLGSHTPEAIGDYLAGPNHILPTGGAARVSSPLGVEDFIKRTNVMSFTGKALRRFAQDVKRFAEWEGLEGHGLAVQARLNGR